MKHLGYRASIFAVGFLALSLLCLGYVLEGKSDHVVMAAPVIVANESAGKSTVLFKGLLEGEEYSDALIWGAYEKADIFLSVEGGDIEAGVQASPDGDLWVSSGKYYGTFGEVGLFDAVPATGLYLRVGIRSTEPVTVTVIATVR